MLINKSKVWVELQDNCPSFKRRHSNLITKYTVQYSKGMKDAEILLVIKSSTSVKACSQHRFSYNSDFNIIHFIEF